MSAVIAAKVGIRLRTPHSAPDWFDARSELGRGYRHLPDASLYLLAAARDAGLVIQDADRDRWGVAVASETGSCRLHDEIDESVVTGAAHLISPTLAPHFAHNLLASRLAMEYHITGMCLSVHTPVSAGLDALSLASTAIEAGRVSRVVVGATEAPRRDGSERPEGAIVFTLQARDHGDSAGGPVIDVLRPHPTDLAHTLDAVHTGGPLVVVGADRAAADMLTSASEFDVRFVRANGALSTLGPVAQLLIGSRPYGSVVAVSDSAAVVATVRAHNDSRNHPHSTNTQHMEDECLSRR